MFVVQGSGRGRSHPRGREGSPDEASLLMEDLKTLRLQLVLLQAGCLMASEGQFRVTSSDILFRARKQTDIDALPSTVGQLLGGLGLPTTTSKGRTRFLLDPEII